MAAAAIGLSVAATDGVATARAAAADDAPLVIDTSFVLQTLDPEATHDPTQLLVDKGIYDTLLTQSSKGPVPSLATSFTVSPDAKTFTFRLRKGVKFADGTPLTSADVVFSFQRLENLKKPISTALGGATVTAPDPNTVVITSPVPNPAITEVLTMPTLGIVNSTLLKANGGTDAEDASTTDKAATFFNSQSAGSGPYVLESFETNSQVTLKANPNYWGPKPHFSTVVIRNMLAPTQLLNVQRGSNEVAIDLSNTQASSLKKNSKMQVNISPSPNTFFLALNQDKKVSPVAASPKIRQAIRYALDYDAMLQIGGPGSIRSAGVVPQGVLGALKPSTALKRDLTKAKALVASSGLKNPKIALSYPSGLSINGVDFSTLSQRVKADLAQIGISVSIQGLPVNAFLTAYAAGKLAMSQVYWFVNYPDPSNANSFLPGGNYSVRVNWKTGASPKLEALAKKATATVAKTTRGKLWQQVQLGLNTASPWVTEFQPAQAVAGSANLTNLQLNPVWVMNIAAVGSK